MTDWISSGMAAASGRSGPVILMYHSIAGLSDAPDWEWSLSLSRFREQVHYLQSHGWSFCRISELDFRAPPSSRQVALTFDDAYSDTLAAAEVLASVNGKASWFVVASALSGRSSWDDEGVSGRRTLLPSQLRDLLTSGMEVGAHSTTHRRLALIDPHELTDETVGCKSAIEDSIGTEIVSFAYPYGSYNDRVVSAVERAGFRKACITKNGPTFEDRSNFLFRRVGIKATDTLSDFKRKLLFRSDDADFRGIARSMRKLIRERLS